MRFLTAEWRTLLMLNYEIDPSVLLPLVPRGTQLDPFQGKHFVSLVGFLFLNTRVLGLPVPFHRSFEEVNLRFYVRHESMEGPRRGVVFAREIVPKAAIAWVARTLYNEQYVAHRMSHRVQLPVGDKAGVAQYCWTAGGREHILRADFEGAPCLPRPGSEEEFITEHYWGYTAQRDGSTLQYRVEHPQWGVWRAAASRTEVDVAGFYGPELSQALANPPSSAFIAEGSAVAVYKGEPLGS